VVVDGSGWASPKVHLFSPQLGPPNAIFYMKKKKKKLNKKKVEVDLGYQ
jgi:hypothetical protein